MSFTLFGKTPLFKKPFFIIRPYLPPKKDINKILSKLYATRYLTNNGYYVQKFEEKLQEYIGVKHIILLSSGTIALQLVIRSLEIKKETIMPSFTFVATAHSAKWEGVVPVFSDIEKDYFTINPSKIETLINDKTQAIIAVHLFGNPCDIEILQSLCSRYKLKLIFDAAQALGSVYKNKRVGAFGDAEVFSLHATKIINALEGGFVATNNTELYDKIKLMRNFGFKDYDHVVSIGINAKMNELSAAIGMYSLQNIEKNIRMNKENFDAYTRLLKNIPGITPFIIRPDCRSNYNYYPILIDKSFIVTRDQLCDIFWHENVITRRYYYPGCHRHAPYNHGTQYNDELPITDMISNTILCLPCFPGMGIKKLKVIVKIIKHAYEKHNTIRKYYSKHKINIQTPI